MNGEVSGADRHDDESPHVLRMAFFGRLRELSLNGINSMQLAHEEADYKDVRPVEQHARGEGRRVEAELVIQCSGEPAAECHSDHGDHQQGWNAPRRLG